MATTTPTEAQRQRPRETLKILYDHKLENAPGMSIIGIQLSFVPNAWTPPHRHGGATVVAVVNKGQMLSGMNGNPPKVYGPGESFMEKPGCHHTVGENYSQTEGLEVTVVMVVDSEVVKDGYAGLVVLDEEWR